MKKFLLIFVVLLFGCNKSEISVSTNSQAQDSNQVSILSFNIQIFGVSKISKPEVVRILVDIIKDYDIIAVQEVRDSSATAVVEFMKLLPLNYSYIIGPREGRSSSKEQYWFIYDSTKFKVLGNNTYPDLQDVFERNPEGVYFQHINEIFDFVLINKHVAPGDAVNEISYIPLLFDYYSSLYNELDVIVVGDFNADGSYFNESKLIEIFPEEKYTIIIDNSLNTTVAASQNTYDRIIISKSMQEDFQGKYGVYVFNDIIDFSKLTIQPKEVSDHYPVWAYFFIDRDTN